MNTRTFVRGLMKKELEAEIKMNKKDDRVPKTWGSFLKQLMKTQGRGTKFRSKKQLKKFIAIATKVKPTLHNQYYIVMGDIGNIR